MSILPFAISVATAAAEDLLSLVIIRQRNIGGFVADVTIEERHTDILTVTENPVEQGAAITDHAFKRPAELLVRVGYSNSSLASGGDPNYVQEMYDQFLTLQASLIPFDVITGKRMYSNMMITDLRTVTTEEWENSMILEVGMREVILVDTQAVSVPPSTNMANPQVNGATQNLGANQLTPGTTYNAAASPVGQ